MPEVNISSLIDNVAYVLTTDSGGVILSANLRFANRSGFDVSSLSGSEIWKLQNAERAKEIADGIIERTLSTGIQKQEFCLTTRSGFEFWVEFSVQMLTQNVSTPTLLWIGYDINDRKETERALAENLVLFNTIKKSTAVGLLIADNHGMCKEVNPEWLKITGIRTTAALKDGWMESLYPEDREKIQATWRAFVGEDNRQNLSLDYRYRKPDGTVRWVSATAVRLYGVDGKLTGFVRSEIDITERKQFEEELKNHQDHLQQLVDDQTRDLIIQKEKAEAASLAKSEFLANMSHEIRTPLNGVLGIAGLLMDTAMDDEQRKYVQIIQKSGDALLEIISDILDVSKIEAGELELETINFSLYSTVEDVTNFMMFRAQEKHIELLVEFASDVQDFYVGDVGRIRQIVLNLLTNAIKFTDEGYVLLRVSSKDMVGKQVRLFFEVEDTGIGIPADKQNYIFNKFTQAEESTTRKFGGTGLGLAICKSLVEMMGGTIGVRSEPKKGSTFFFDIVLPYGEKKDEDIAYPEIDLSGVRTLVVDDLPVNGKILSGYLQRWGMVSEVALTAKDALLLLEDACTKRKPYQIAFIDRQMPEVGGVELARQIKSDERLKYTVLIMITSSSSGAVASPQSILQGGFLGFCMKPYHPLQLKNLMLRVWEAHENRNYGQLITHNSVPLHLSREPALRAEKNGTAAGSTSQQGKRILVVDDMPVNRTLLVETLKKMEHSVDIAANGIEALAHYKKNNYDIIFMDCHMPEMDGYQATQEIRKLEDGNKRTPIVAITADAMKGNEQNCIDAGMDDFLTKPLKKEKLGIIINKWIGKQSV